MKKIKPPPDPFEVVDIPLTEEEAAAAALPYDPKRFTDIPVETYNESPDR